MQRIAKSWRLLAVGVIVLGTAILTSCIPPAVSPTAIITANPQSGAAPLLVQFDGSSSRSADGQVLTYEWSFEDGDTNAGTTALRSYSKPGDYRVGLRVTDERGASDSTSILIHVSSPTQSESVATPFDVTAGITLEHPDGVDVEVRPVGDVGTAYIQVAVDATPVGGGDESLEVVRVFSIELTAGTPSSTGAKTGVSVDRLADVTTATIDVSGYANPDRLAVCTLGADEQWYLAMSKASADPVGSAGGTLTPDHKSIVVDVPFESATSTAPTVRSTGSLALVILHAIAERVPPYEVRVEPGAVEATSSGARMPCHITSPDNDFFGGVAYKVTAEGATLTGDLVPHNSVLEMSNDGADVVLEFTPGAASASLVFDANNPDTDDTNRGYFGIKVMNCVPVLAGVISTIEIVRDVATFAMEGTAALDAGFLWRNGVKVVKSLAEMAGKEIPGIKFLAVAKLAAALVTMSMTRSNPVYSLQRSDPYSSDAPGIAAPGPVSPGSFSAPGEQVANFIPTLSWIASPEANIYRVKVSTATYGSQGVIWGSDALPDTSIGVPVGVLQSGQSYYWVVQAGDGREWSPDSMKMYFRAPSTPAPVAVTLYVHDGSVSGPILNGVAVSGTDGAGSSLSVATDPSGYVTLTGQTGTWHVSASKVGYQATTWDLNVSTTTTCDRCLIPDGGSQPVTARLVSYSATPQQVPLGQPVTLTATVQNTGGSDWTFYIAVSLKKPNGSHVNLDLKPLTLSAGQQGTATWSYVPDTSGAWDIYFGVWKEQAEQNSLAATGWLNDYISASSPPTDVSGTIMGWTVTPSPATAGQSVGFQFVVKNTGTGTYTFPVGLSVWKVGTSIESAIINEWKTVTLTAGQEQTVTFSSYPFGSDRVGEWYYQFGIWKSDYSTLLDKEPSPAQILTVNPGPTTVSGTITAWLVTPNPAYVGQQAAEFMCLVQNTGTSRYTFPVGLSVWKVGTPIGTALINLWAAVTLNPGESQLVALPSHTFASSEVGSYYYQFGLWKGDYSTLLDKEPAPAEILNVLQ